MITVKAALIRARDVASAKGDVALVMRINRLLRIEGIK